MLKKVLLAITALQISLFAEFITIGTDEMLELQKQGAPIIDIRTPGEWKQTGVIPGSQKIMFFDERGNYDVDKFMGEFTKVVKDTNQSFVLVCRTASRTKTVGNFLSKQLGYQNTKELGGGIMFGWLNDGRKTEK